MLIQTKGIKDSIALTLVFTVFGRAENIFIFLFLDHFPKKPCFFTCLHYTSFENTVGKGEIAQQLFGQLSSNMKLSSANSFSLEV